MWVEVNARVNYPIKEVLIDMLETGNFSMDNDREKFCVSWFTIQVAAIGVQLFVAAWNEHPIPGTCMHGEGAIAWLTSTTYKGF